MNQNIAIILIIVLAAVVFGGFYFLKSANFFAPDQTNTTSSLESFANDCLNAGGTVEYAQCCLTAGDFPNSCLIGACGCSLDNSHQVNICKCPEGQCWDGTTCVSANQQTQTITQTSRSTTSTTSITLFTQTQSITSSISPPPVPV